MESGTVTKVVVDRGFGFISRDNGKGDVFFHYSQVGDGLEFNETLQERRVRFDVQETPRGWQAVCVCAAN